MEFCLLTKGSGRSITGLSIPVMSFTGAWEGGSTGLSKPVVYLGVPISVRRPVRSMTGLWKWGQLKKEGLRVDGIQYLGCRLAQMS